MAASHAAMQQSPGEAAAEMSASMEAHASSGDWERVEEIAVKLRSAIMQVPERERRSAIRAAQRSVEKVQALAQESRTDVTGKLAAIRRGKDATAAYGNATGSEPIVFGPADND